MLNRRCATKAGARMNDRDGTKRGPLRRMSPAQLDGLLSSLSVEFVRLTECVVSPGWRLNLGGSAAPGIHYNLTGRGRVVMEGHPPFELYPHTLFITPPNQYFFVEVPSKDGSADGSKEVEGRWK